MRLSAHFRTEEFDCHDGTPVPAHAYHELRELVRVFLEPVRHEWGPTTITSGYRTRRVNALVGGTAGSFHVYEAGRWGVAADFVCRRGTPRDWADQLEHLGVPGLGRYPDHCHADNRRGHARW